MTETKTRNETVDLLGRIQSLEAAMVDLVGRYNKLQKIADEIAHWYSNPNPGHLKSRVDNIETDIENLKDCLISWCGASDYK